jgi:hypothetical protein
LNFGRANLQRGLDFEAPSFQEWLRDVLGVLVAAGPFPQPGRPQILVWLELELAHNLFKFSNRGGHRADWFRLSPVRVSTSSSHNDFAHTSRGMYV